MANPPKDGDAKLRAYSPSRIWPPSRRRQVRSEFAALIAVDEGFLILRPFGGEIIVDSIIVASRSNAAPAAPLLQARALSDEVAGVTRPHPLTLTLPRVTPAKNVRANQRRHGTDSGRNPLSGRRYRVGPGACKLLAYRLPHRPAPGRPAARLLARPGHLTAS